MKSSLPAIMIVCGGVLQIPAIEEARRLGLFTIVTDRNLHAAAMKYADLPLVIDIWDIKGHIKAAKKLAKQCNLVGVYTQGADVETTVAQTAAAVGLPATNPQAALNCKNKAQMRRNLSKHKINQVKFGEVKTVEEAKEALKDIGFPAIVKNVDNSGSRGTSVISKIEELPFALEQAKTASHTNTALIEQFLVGSEHSVDMVVYKGKFYPAGICDRPFSPPPYRVELGHINLTKLSPKMQQEIYKLTEKSGRVLGINFGVAKADILLTKNGPVILEMTNRLSGGFDSQYTKPLATGMNLIRPTLKMAIGGKPDMDDLKVKWKKFSACLAIFPKAGKIKDIQGVDDALKIPNITNIILLKNIGETIANPKSSAERFGFAISVANTYNQAVQRCHQAISKIKVITK